MPTMKQKVDRIEVARQNIITSINNKGVVVASDAGIETLSGKVDDIQQGGGTENSFMSSTDLSYMFYGKESSNTKIIDGLERFKQNSIDNLSYAFYNFNDNIITTDATKADKISEIIEYILNHYHNINLYSAFSYMKHPTNTHTYTIDCSNSYQNGSCESIFNRFGNTSATNAVFLFIIPKTFFENATSVKNGFTYAREMNLKLIDRELKFKSSVDGIFNSYNGVILDENGNQLKELTISFENATTNDLYFSQAFDNTSQFERIHLKGASHINRFDYSFRKCTNLKSVDGLDFSNAGTGYLNMFGTTNLTKFGELGIVNNTGLGSGNKSLPLNKIWTSSASTVIDGQTIGYWYEKFANALANAASTGTQTITINTTLYNSLTQAQKELITDKGYSLASAS